MKRLCYYIIHFVLLKFILQNASSSYQQLDQTKSCLYSLFDVFSMLIPNMDIKLESEFFETSIKIIEGVVCT